MIPDDWYTVKTKHVLSGLQDGTHGTFERTDSGYPLLSAKNITENGIVVGGKESFISQKDFDSIVSNGFPQKNDVTLCCVGTIGRCCIYDKDYPMAFQRSVTFMRPNEKITSRFLMYAIKAIYFQDQLNKSAKASAQSGIYLNDVANTVLFIPSLEEQKIIATYLDYKVGQIDMSISEIDSQIDSLKAYRQSVISEAVTKGLDKNAKMKDSGVEWIGEIPEGWAIQKIKNVLFPSKDGIKIGPFGSSLTGKIDTIGNYKVYGQWNIVGRDFSAGKNYVDSDTYNDLSAYHITAGDILVSMMGTVGKCAIIPDGVAKGLMDSHVVKVRLNKEKIIPEFFEYVYDKDNSNVVISQIQKYRRGSIMDGLNSSLIKEFVIPIPPIDEQKRIVAYLDTKVSLIDELISSFNAQHSDLNALKQAIISEAVTGKIDLRDWTPSVEQ